MKNIDEIREIFRHDTFATNNGAVIDEVGEGYAKCSLTIGDGHRNAAGGVMGGVPFMLADFAFAVAVPGSGCGQPVEVDVQRHQRPDQQRAAGDRRYIRTHVMARLGGSGPAVRHLRVYLEGLSAGHDSDAGGSADHLQGSL